LRCCDTVQFARLMMALPVSEQGAETYWCTRKTQR
jgi:hypothetical protein